MVDQTITNEIYALPSGVSKTVLSIGEGSPLLVVHGGPGMDFSYLLEALKPLASGRRLFFYEQSPTIGDPAVAPTAETQIEELAGLTTAIAGRLDSPVSLLGHSWGTFLILGALATMRSHVSRITLVNPMPLTWNGFLEAGGRLMGKVRVDDLNSIDRLEQEGTEAAGLELMKLVAYAYVAKANVGKIDIGVKRYNPAVNAAVLASIEGYDQRDVLTSLGSLRPVLIFGEEDHFIKHDVADLATVSESHTLSNAGHFPFSEQPLQLVELVSTLA